MAIFQITLFNKFDRWGWTYSWTMSTGFDDPNGYNLSTAFAIAWTGLHNNGTTLYGYETRNLDKPRLALVRNLPYKGIAGATPAHPNFSIKVNIRGEAGANRYISLRGLPATWPAINPDTGQPQLPGVATGAVNAFIQAMVNEGAQIRMLDTVEVNPPATIGQITHSTFIPGKTQFTSTPDIGINAGDRVKISKNNDCQMAGINGMWNILAINGTAAIIPRKWSLPTDVVIEPDEAEVRKVSYTQRAITGWNIARVGSRDTGRPIGLTHGKSKGVSCRL